MKVNGKMITGKEKVWKNILMGINMKEISKKEKLTEKEFIIGKTEKFMTENGKMVLKKGTEYGKEYLEILISVNGKIVKQMVMEFTNGKMVIDMKVLG
jgi:hypothetical protein